MMANEGPLAVSFDFGQTLADLDMAMLSRRLAERAVAVEAGRLDACSGAAWSAYNDAIRSGLGGHPWRILMRRLLSEAAAPEDKLDELVDWLWSEQPRRNLWRRPVPGMMELVGELRRNGVPLAIVSNSEGRLAEHVAEIGWDAYFNVLADSGKLGWEKPDRAIFEWASERLGVPTDRVVHVGDSFAADIEGALGVGMRAIWFGGDRARAVGDRVHVCHSAEEVRAVLYAFGLQGAPIPQAIRS